MRIFLIFKVRFKTERFGSLCCFFSFDLRGSRDLRSEERESLNRRFFSRSPELR